MYFEGSSKSNNPDDYKVDGIPISSIGYEGLVDCYMVMYQQMGMIARSRELRIMSARKILDDFHANIIVMN